MKLWKCDAVGPIEGLLTVTVVVMAETRQQAIEKASAGLSAKLPEILGQTFPEDDDRRFAQLGPDASTAGTSSTTWRRCPMRW